MCLNGRQPMRHINPVFTYWILMMKGTGWPSLYCFAHISRFPSRTFGANVHCIVATYAFDIIGGIQTKAHDMLAL